jgi:hypothetical protein
VADVPAALVLTFTRTTASRNLFVELSIALDATAVLLASDASVIVMP